MPKLDPAAQPFVWKVGALCRAVADSLAVQFNPVVVQGEISGWSAAGSGHCYFSIKDDAGQMRCAMFRRAALLLDFQPRDGQLVKLKGRLSIYEPRGDLQLIVESMGAAGEGSLMEAFLQRKAKLQAEGLFDAGRKRPIPRYPRCIGIVTSLSAAALHDVVTALQRRVPHVSVLIAPAAVQGSAAPEQLCDALESLYTRSEPRDLTTAKRSRKPAQPARVPELILLVRGGGSLEDLWAFNDENLARCIARSPVPVIAGVGHETDFTIADFVADLRAPTPTAAAELAAASRDEECVRLQSVQAQMQRAVEHRLDREAQRLDRSQQKLGQPSAALHQLHRSLDRLEGQLRQAAVRRGQQERHRLVQLRQRWLAAQQESQHRARASLSQLQLRLERVNPEWPLQRGYALLLNAQGGVVSNAQDVALQERLTAHLSKGRLALEVVEKNRVD